MTTGECTSRCLSLIHIYLKVGDYILASKLSNKPAAENAYLYSLDGSKYAISVTIKSFATGLSGKLESGDIVSVLVADYQGMGETVIPPELQYVEVISVTASSGYDANTCLLYTSMCCISSSPKRNSPMTI